MKIKSLAARVGDTAGPYDPPVLGPGLGAPLPQPPEADTALYETLRRAARRLQEALLLPLLKWAGAALLVVSCALMVYFGAVLLARLMLWAFYP